MGTAVLTVGCVRSAQLELRVVDARPAVKQSLVEFEAEVESVFFRPPAPVQVPPPVTQMPELSAPRRLSMEPTNS